MHAKYMTLSLIYQFLQNTFYAFNKSTYINKSIKAENQPGEAVK